MVTYVPMFTRLANPVAQPMLNEWLKDRAGQSTAVTSRASPRRCWDEDAKEWRDAASFQPSDLPGLIYLLQQALAFCCGNGELPSGGGPAASPEAGDDPAGHDVPF